MTSMKVKIYTHKRQARFSLNNEVTMDLLYENNFTKIGFMQNQSRCFFHLCISLAYSIEFIFTNTIDLILDFRSCLIGSHTDHYIIVRGGDV